MKFAIRYKLLVTPVKQKSPVSEPEAGRGAAHTAGKQLESEVATSAFGPVTKALKVNPLRESDELCLSAQTNSSLPSTVMPQRELATV